MSNKIKNKLKRKLLYPLRVITSKNRRDPKFIIIGVQKGGTTSLYNYLCQHPKIQSAIQKEIHFFDLNYEKGSHWYKTHFPLKRQDNMDCITGEATPYYFFHPLVPKRVKELYPDIKIILLLRNPTERALSHYNMEVNRGHETRPLEIAIKEDIEYNKLEENALRDRLVKFSKNHMYLSYYSRGLYAKQLNNWMQYFNIEQFIILEKNDFFKNINVKLGEIFSFLNVSNEGIQDIKYEVKNKGIYKTNLKSNYLNKLYKNPNQQLFDLIGKTYNW